MKPEANPTQFIRMLRQLKGGKIGFANLAELGGRHIETKDVSVSYLGYGIKR